METIAGVTINGTQPGRTTARPAGTKQRRTRHQVEANHHHIADLFQTTGSPDQMRPLVQAEAPSANEDGHHGPAKELTRCGLGSRERGRTEQGQQQPIREDKPFDVARPDSVQTSP